jgi:UDP-glucuronate decarboxylase
VDDLVDGLVRLMGTPESVTGPINLGNPDEFSIRALAETVIELTGSSSRILPTDDPRQRQPDISKAKETLDWKPSAQLRDGLRKTIGYFERLMQGKPATP